MNKTSFLYPFLEEGERDPQTLMTELARSAHEKMLESRRLIDRSLIDNREVLERAAVAMAVRMRAGGSVLTFGNGGSACDALAFVRQLDGVGGIAAGARSLVADPAVLSALGNDLGAELMFSRQIEAFARSSDIAMAFSTSGQSANVLRALGIARRRGMLTIASAGYQGGSMTENADVDHCIVIGSDSVHRVQEAQAQLASRLCTLLEVQVTSTEEHR